MRLGDDLRLFGIELELVFQGDAAIFNGIGVSGRVSRDRI